MENEVLTREDLKMFRLQLLNDIKDLLQPVTKTGRSVPLNLDWAKGSQVRAALNISPGTLQNYRIAGTVRFKKFGGTYYYNIKDLKNMFNK
ncbi:hypothetical protein [Mucilaginibacter paludis]|uniref:Helix-turn-helix domain-containing protein n=1 Tax=Mucilaginibacter paludis DSM 18603 TaxID=714943 RepID=H1YAF9_9SPHI|nr:hypothetical protein [Mucilaginibacter paludis]EHQ27002.1 hypothetical protein Mucpa_2893 [Mucilaginibacter paludis DSM 18603]